MASRPRDEWVTALVAAFFANGLYQLVFLFAAGPVLPVRTPALLLPPQGGASGGSRAHAGLRNTIDLAPLQYALDDLLPVRIVSAGEAGFRFPLATMLAVALVAGLLVWIRRTRFGHEVRAVGEDIRVASAVGIDVSRVRVLAMAISTALAALGQVVSLQNLGTLNTYSAHEQVATFAIAALLVSGATIRHAGVIQALVGTLLFHAFFVVAPLAGKELAHDAQVGEYLRSFLAYAVICASLSLHATRRGAMAGGAGEKKGWPGRSETR